MVDSSATVPSEEDTPLNPTRKEEDEDHNDDYDDDDLLGETLSSIWSSRNVILSKCILAGVVLYAALLAYSSASSTQMDGAIQDGGYPRRRLTAVMGETIPSYMNDLMEDLKGRKKLFEETPAEEVKYWFEYTGPLQVSRNNSSELLWFWCFLQCIFNVLFFVA